MTEVVVVVRSRLFAYVVMWTLVASVNSPLKAVSHVGLVVAPVVVLVLVLVECPWWCLLWLLGRGCCDAFSCASLSKTQYSSGIGSPSRRPSTFLTSAFVRCIYGGWRGGGSGMPLRIRMARPRHESARCLIRQHNQRVTFESCRMRPQSRDVESSVCRAVRGDCCGGA